MHCTAKALRTCSFAPLLHDLRANAEPDREAEHNTDFIETMDAFYESGDHFDYDGPLTSVSTDSVCF